MYIIYETKQRSGISILSVYFLILLFLIYFFTIKGFTWFLLYLFVIDLFLFINFYKLTFRVTSEGVEFGFGIFKRRIKKQLIDSVFIDNSFGNFSGAGIIFGRGSWGFIAKSGNGLKIILKNKAVFFVTTDDPQKALEKINLNI